MTWVAVAGIGSSIVGAGASIYGASQAGKGVDLPPYIPINIDDLYNKAVSANRRNIEGARALEQQYDPIMAMMRPMASQAAAGMLGQSMDRSGVDNALRTYQQSVAQGYQPLQANPLAMSGLLNQANNLASGQIGTERTVGMSAGMPSKANLGAMTGMMGAGVGIPQGNFGALQNAPTVNLGQVSAQSVAPTVSGNMTFNRLKDDGMDLDFGAGEDPEVDAKLSREIQNLVARQAGAAAAGAGLGGGQAGRDIVARDLGITALDLYRQRQQDARAFQDQQFGQRITQQQQRLAQQGQMFEQEYAEGTLNTERQGMQFDQGLANAQMGLEAGIANLDARAKQADLNRLWNQQAFEQRFNEADFGRLSQQQAFNQRMDAQSQGFDQRYKQSDYDLTRQQQMFNQDFNRYELGQKNIGLLGELGMYQQNTLADQQRLAFDVDRFNTGLQQQSRAEQLGLAEMLDRTRFRDLTTSLGYVAGTPLPEYGLSPQDLVNLEIANLNARSQLGATNAQIAAGNANARTQMWSNLGSSLMGLAGQWGGQAWGTPSTPSWTV